MRDLFKKLVVGVVLLASPCVFAIEPYKLLVIPDNIMTNNETVDSYIYGDTAEFFASEVINILNTTDYIKAPTVSEERQIFKSSPDYVIPVRILTRKFKTSYLIDHTYLNKISKKTEARYVLLITSSIDSENYVLRRTIWDFLNIAGATVIDPAYKISTYAALVDTSNDRVLWSNTFYKTISVVENRIITRGPSPQTEQLKKIRDYSRMLCPEIAHNVQKKILPPQEYTQESTQIYYDMGDFDNEFTKKYRRWYKEGSKDYNKAKTKVDTQLNTAKDATKQKYQEYKDKYEDFKYDRQYKKQLDVKAEPINKNNINIEPSNDTIDNLNNFWNSKIQNINNRKKSNYKYELQDQNLYPAVNIEKTRTNTLIEEERKDSRPALRDYNY